MAVWVDYLIKISISLAVIGYLMSFAISYKSHGIAEGLAIGKHDLEEFKTGVGYTETIHISRGIGGTYDHFALDYGWLSWLFAISIFAFVLIRIEGHFQVKITGYALVTLSVLLILYILHILIRDKAFVEPYFWEGPRNSFAYQTITYDWILVGISLSMMVCLAAVFILRRPGARSTY